MSFTIIEQATPRLHRSELAVPGSNPDCSKRRLSQPPTLFFSMSRTLSLPTTRSRPARTLLAGLNDINWGTKTMMVRINGLDTHYMYRDVVDIVEACPRLDMILIPRLVLRRMSMRWTCW